MTDSQRVTWTVVAIQHDMITKYCSWWPVGNHKKPAIRTDKDQEAYGEKGHPEDGEKRDFLVEVGFSC